MALITSLGVDSVIIFSLDNCARDFLMPYIQDELFPGLARRAFIQRAHIYCSVWMAAAIAIYTTQQSSIRWLECERCAYSIYEWGATLWVPLLSTTTVSSRGSSVHVYIYFNCCRCTVTLAWKCLRYKMRCSVRYNMLFSLQTRTGRLFENLI